MYPKLFRYGKMMHIVRGQLKFARREVKGQRICELYDDAYTITEIAKKMSLTRRYVKRALKLNDRL